MKKTSTVVMETTNYGMIKYVQGNRLINPKNVEVIKESMMKKQLIVPAILNENMEIIDGQHRLEACKQLNLPFYFIIVEGYSLKEVQQVNANMKNWNMNDFLDSFIDLYKIGHAEYSEYIKLKDFIEKHQLPLSTALALSNLRIKDKDRIDNFMQGNFKFYNFAISEELAIALADFKRFDSYRWNQKSFAVTFASFYLNSDYNHVRMIKNLPFTHDRLKLMGSKASIISNLLEMYNYKSSKKDKLYQDRIQDAWTEMLSDD